MRVLLDLFVINLSALLAFVLRQNFGDVIIKDAPSLFWPQYLFLLLLLDISYPFILWLLGLYDRRQKRALLEEFMLIFGVFSTSIAILIVFLFLGRLWWMSRIVLFLFYAFSVNGLCLIRVLTRSKVKENKIIVNLQKVVEQMKRVKLSIESNALPKLSIVVVTFNSLDKVGQLLKSLKEAKIKVPYEIVIVDNNSNDNLEEYLKANFSYVNLIKSTCNAGYTKAVNIGLNACKSDYCLILNPDIIVYEGSVEIILDYVLANPGVGITGCKLLNYDNTVQDSVRRFLDLRTYLYRFTPLRGLLKGSEIEKYYLMHNWDHNDNRLVDWVLGGCMLVRRKAWEEVGMMDEKFFLYFDDVDWCFRMWEKGWKVAYVADAIMVHKHMRASANKLFSRSTREHLKSLGRFILKHGFRFPPNCPSSQGE